MQVSNANDIKIYNLSYGKSLPEWATEAQKKKAKKDPELRNRIELLQEFEMPGVSDCIQISPDGQFILASGTYKPRVRCYEVGELSLKFERCFDAEVVKFLVLSEDYSKLLFLQCDRYIEIHAQYGKYYRIRIPKFGRDLSYHPQTCDAYFVGAGPEIYRLNLEQGRYLNPYCSDSAELNACEINPEHQLLVVGTIDGKVEAWDPRSRQRAGILDCALGALTSETTTMSGLPEVTALQFRDGLNLGVGTSTGHVLLYDIRSSKPMLVKDQMNEIPIKKVLFHSTLDQVLSMDAKVVKIWDRQSGKPYTSIEGDAALNDLCIYPNSGLMFMANEQAKMQAHYIPTLGPAPQWCYFLDNLTEELEESETTTVYDDYKFITKQELDDLGLDHLIGTNLLRAYMHGYFMDVRLYTKAMSIAQPYTLDRFVKDKVKSKMDEEKKRRVQLESKLPQVNKDLFLKLKDNEMNKKKKVESNLLGDDRFKGIFNDPRFEIDKTEEAYRLINPVVSKLDPKKKAEIEQRMAKAESSDDEDRRSEDSDIESESSDDDREWVEKVKEQHKQIRMERAAAKAQEKHEKLLQKIKGPQLVEVNGDAAAMGKKKKKQNKSLAERIETEPIGELVSLKEGGHQMTFRSKTSKKTQIKEEAQKKHLEERHAIARSAKGIRKNKLPPKFWMGRRVK